MPGLLSPCPVLPETEGAKMILIRQFERQIVFVQPRHGHFQGAPGVEAGRSRIGVRHAFRFDGGLKQHRPFGLKELEMGGSHGFNVR